MNLIHPIQGRITQYFGENVGFYKRWGYCCGHNGVDYGVPNNTPVYASAKGKVDKIAYESGGYGTYVVLRHNGEYKTYYAHLNNVMVSPGDRINQGDIIAFSNNTGASTGPHLHFGLRIGTGGGMKGYVDPLPFLGGNDYDPIDYPGAVKYKSKFKVLSKWLNVRSSPSVRFDNKIGELDYKDVITSKRVYSDSLWIEFEPGKWCAITHQGKVYLQEE